MADDLPPPLKVAPTPAVLTEVVARALVQRHPGITVDVVADLHLELRGALPEAAKRVTLHLDALWRSCSAPSADWETEVASYLAQQLLPRITVSSDSLVTLLRTSEYVEHLLDAPVTRRFAGDLEMVLFAQADSGHRRVVVARHLEPLGMNASQALELGISNLQRRASLDDVREHPEFPRLLVVDTDDRMAAGRLLLPELWTAAARVIGPVICAVAPSEDLVFIAGAASEEDIGTMMSEARRYHERAINPLSTCPLVWSGAGWQAAL